MKKKMKIIIIVFIILISGAFLPKLVFKLFRNTDTIIHKVGYRLFELNTINVKVNGEIDINDFEIKQGDIVLFSLGKQINKFNQEYGISRLSIYYRKLELFEIGHWRRNNWYTNDYVFNISKKDKRIILKTFVEGPDSDNDFYQKEFVRDENGKLERIEYFDSKEINYRIENKKEQKEIKHYNEPLDLIKVKERFDNTSSVLSSEKSNEFCNPNKSYFFGMYFLIGNNETPFGRLTIYIKDKVGVWQSDNTNEEFAEINLKTDEIAVWDSIVVGMKEKELLDFIGSSFHYKKGTSVYAELGEYSGRFRINADTICELTVGKIL